MNPFRLSTATAVAALATLIGSATTHASTMIVPGTSDPWLAGMPDLTSASFNPGSGEPADFAPAQSPVLVNGVCITPGTPLTWRARGEVAHPGDLADPDGKPWLFNTTHFTGAENGLSDINVPIDALLGVFLGPSRPDLFPAPGALDFSTDASRNYSTLAPALQQVFFMGDGATDANLPQTLIAPPGATRLFLGTMDGYSWNNNSGSFEVTINGTVPDGGSTLALCGGAFTLLCLAGRRFRP